MDIDKLRIYSVRGVGQDFERIVVAGSVAEAAAEFEAACNGRTADSVTRISYVWDVIGLDKLTEQPEKSK